MPPVVLLAAVHGIALAVRASASGRVYRCAVGAIALIAVGAFTVSFLALRDLMIAIGYSSSTAWIFPLIIDTAVAVSTVMLVALGGKPQRRVRTAKPNSGSTTQVSADDTNPARNAKSQVDARGAQRRVQAGRVLSMREGATGIDADVAAQLVARKVTAQPVQTVVAVLVAHRGGASINAAAKAAGVNFRTAQRIVNGASEMPERYAVAC